MKERRENGSPKLRLLVSEYGVTVVLSTATQPAFDDTPYIKELAGTEIREIVPEFSRHFTDLRRVRFTSRQAPLPGDDSVHGTERSGRTLVKLAAGEYAKRLLERATTLDVPPVTPTMIVT